MRRMALLVLSLFLPTLALVAQGATQIVAQTGIDFLGLVDPNGKRDGDRY